MTQKNRLLDKVGMTDKEYGLFNRILQMTKLNEHNYDLNLSSEIDRMIEEVLLDDNSKTEI